MKDDRKNRLIELGAEALAEALLELESQNDAAHDVVERMLATAQENVRRFKSKLARLKRRERFVSRRESADLAHTLEGLLDDLRAGVEDPRTGVELLASFYESGEVVMARCDDSIGRIGDTFRFRAKDLFVYYGSRCEDKQWLGELVLRLNLDDAYCLRDVLVDCAADYLPEPVLRDMAASFQEIADRQTDRSDKRHWLHLIEPLARQLKDPALFEKTRIAAWGELNVAACIDIAEVYLESGDPETALSWLEPLPDDAFHSHRRNPLLFAIYGKLGRQDRKVEIAWEIFRSYRSAESLDEMLSVIGEDLRESVISGEAEAILKDPELSYSNAEFLIEVGRVEDAETYILARAGELDGDLYGSLTPLAKSMEAGGRHHAATVLYRALLDSILESGNTRAYSHGVRYLKKLDKMAASVSDWKSIPKHWSYVSALRTAHGRKHSFWSRYDK